MFSLTPTSGCLKATCSTLCLKQSSLFSNSRPQKWHKVSPDDSFRSKIKTASRKTVEKNPNRVIQYRKCEVWWKIIITVLSSIFANCFPSFVDCLRYYFHQLYNSLFVLSSVKRLSLLLKTNRCRFQSRPTTKTGLVGRRKAELDNRLRPRVEWSLVWKHSCYC